MKKSFYLLLSALIISAPGFALALGVEDGHSFCGGNWGWMQNMMGNWGWPMMGWGFGFINLFLWIAIIAGVVYFIKYLVRAGKRWDGGDDKDSAVKILNERYAKGEIDKTEYEQKKKDLLG